MKHFDVGEFIKEGYLLIRKEEIIDYSNVKDVEYFKKNIVHVRKAMKFFFQLPMEDKNRVLGSHAVDPETGCYYSGWRGIDKSAKQLYGMDFPLEYYYFRDLHASTGEDICFPKKSTYEMKK